MKVFVGISGGVDSSTSAALLKEAGHEVTGVFIRAWQPPFMECSIGADRNDAMRACVSLGIPFHELDLSELYKKEVVDYMVSEYAKGRTPNPDVMCNEHIKFGAFYKWAMEQGADAVATGHYAQIKFNNKGDAELHAGNDSSKDQSYFLWRVPKSELSKIQFPVGAMEKTDVRAHAKKFGLPTAEKKDSQGLCFLGKVDLKEFLTHFITEKPGAVINSAGEEIGRHDGAMFFTIGERHGFTVTKKSPTDGPWYIAAKDLNANTLTVVQKAEETATPLTNAVPLEHMNWLGALPEEEKIYECRFRYRQPLRSCRVKIEDTKTNVFFMEPQEFVPSGQSLVIYDGTRVVGGGIIV